jgi:hypothetical protein
LYFSGVQEGCAVNLIYMGYLMKSADMPGQFKHTGKATSKVFLRPLNKHQLNQSNQLDQWFRQTRFPAPPRVAKYADR